ncbi:SH3 domain-containing protein [Peribacillus huizhouensis]|uniref:N-acetylmuramoyl-L-alanine amidase n=1 Tax=Peribacillus huizhouensis TaxID=1501239 RepID=A0ABR6CKX7_9BACI|nr:SH3 domain-containing protein [Peribacillus huizhouensis]MBA9025690.1 N-acetylmuramoyl-L-alanine amidase [Peribacillus huizhouensis]
MKTKTYIAGILTAALLTSSGFSIQPVYGQSNSDITVNTEVINVREGPALSFPVVEEVYRGSTYQVVSEENDWLEIKLGENKSGWIAGYLVADHAERAKRLEKATVTSDHVRIRKGPGTTFEETGYINSGTEISILDRDNNWIHFKNETISGWISADFIQAGRTENKVTNVQPVKATGIALTNNLNVRASASKDGRVIGKLKKDATISFEDIQGEWGKITLNGESGWVNTSFIAIDGEEKATVTASELVVRKFATTDGEIIATVHQGDSFTILQERNDMAKIQYESGKTGWVATRYLQQPGKSVQTVPIKEEKPTSSTIVILRDGTSLRSGPDTNTTLLARANKGETFSVLGVENDWYKIQLAEQTAYVAGWLVSTDGQAQQSKQSGIEKNLAGKVIVLDPGHGGSDPGTIGVGGTMEKDLTLRTARMLQAKLEQAGANVILTRSLDAYITLPARVGISQLNAADAYISIHYDATEDTRINGFTTYYYHSYQMPLAKVLDDALSSSLKINNRGYRFGDYHVLRENDQNAVLLELGYLSNPIEEVKITSGSYQEKVTTAIHNGLMTFFK